ncbi:MAG TPA: tetratricopeptide repeat protein, partial [Myxococcota bacterium]|nr:tetratricopeptide repeat protein [Myxococcota bacterium]
MVRKLSTWVAVVALVAAAAPPGAADDLGDSASVRDALAHAPDELEAMSAQAFAEASAHPDSFEAQLEAAELPLSFANRLRNERKIRTDLDPALDEEYRAQQADWADRAIPRAELALELASDDAERAQAERVLGELYSHRITGMISGMINGPRARRHIGRALELAPDDPECNRAIGLMYLHNPPITGGDVDKAIETFQGCADALPDDRCLVLLSMAYRKHGDLDEARATARKALERDPSSVDAKLLLAELE